MVIGLLLELIPYAKGADASFAFEREVNRFASAHLGAGGSMTTAEQSFRTARAKHLCAADDRLRRRRGPAWEAEQAEKGRRTISAQAHRSRCQRFSDQTTRPSRSAREGRRSEATTTEAGCGSVEPDRPAPGPVATNCSCRIA